MRNCRCLAAEHEFSALVSVMKAARAAYVRAGQSVDGLAHNLDVQIDLADIGAIVLSHGHFDHVGGLNGLIKRFGARRLPCWSTRTFG
jgi:7,8-dihydropterin-6-yl-methyl-4-(beta-D-ribofuranosyl)aminobenzene 5'-phosphate synthase